VETDARPGLHTALGDFLPRTAAGWRLLTTLAIFSLLAIVFEVLSGGIFLTSRNAALLLRQSSVIAVLAAGTGVIMIMGEIDLSIGSAVYLAGLVASQADATWGLPLAVVFLIAVAVGLAMGVFQGFWVARVGVPSFIVTLAGMLAFRGIGQTWTQAATISPLSEGFSHLTEAFVSPALAIGLLLVLLLGGLTVVGISARGAQGRGERLGRGNLIRDVIGLVALVVGLLYLATGFGLPTATLWILAVGAILWFLMTRTAFGRNAYLIGSNRQAAVIAGLRVRWYLFAGFVISGVSYAIGGILVSARLDGSTSQTGTFYELDAIAAAVIGGVSLRGGIGTIPGIVGGAILLSMIDNGMNLVATSTFAQLIVKGGILLGAVALDAYASRRT
jgi:D-xylose transport system permease protein